MNIAKGLRLAHPFGESLFRKSQPEKSDFACRFALAPNDCGIAAGLRSGSSLRRVPRGLTILGTPQALVTNQPALDLVGTAMALSAFSFWSLVAIGGLAGLALLVLLVLYVGSWAGWTQPPKAIQVATWGNNLAPRVFMEGFQIVSAGASIGASFAPTAEKAEWLPPVIAGAVSAGLWKVLQVIVDLVAKKEASRAFTTSAALAGLLSGIRKGVSNKLWRICDAMGPKRPTVNDVEKTLTPEPQLQDLMDHLAIALQIAATSGLEKPNVRVGVYVTEDGHLIPIRGVDLKNAGYNPFTAYKTRKDAFSLNATPIASEVVRCVLEKRTIIVEDCEKEEKAGRFRFTHDEQKKYLKSMVAYHLGEVQHPNGKVEAAIVADSSIKKAFRESLATVLEDIFKEFGLRIRLEMAIQSYLAQRESNGGTSTPTSSSATGPVADSKHPEKAGAAGEGDAGGRAADT